MDVVLGSLVETGCEPCPCSLPAAGSEELEPRTECLSLSRLKKTCPQTAVEFEPLVVELGIGARSSLPEDSEAGNLIAQGPCEAWSIWNFR